MFDDGTKKEYKILKIFYTIKVWNIPKNELF